MASGASPGLPASPHRAGEAAQGAPILGEAQCQAPVEDTPPLEEVRAEGMVTSTALEATAGGRPVLVLRGANSDLLTESALNRMASEIPDVEIVTLPNVGHAPDLSEPESVAGIDRLLERVLKR